MSAPLLEMTGITKTFGGARALDQVNFQLAPGEIHGLLGGNGAGKTTLMNVLYGLYRAEQGEIRLRGQRVEIPSPQAALAHRVGMVHQHLLQINSFTVLENIAVGERSHRAWSWKLAPMEKRIRELAVRFGLEVNPHARVETLPFGIRQRVEILKVLARGVEILILDEPTTSLTPQEVDALFDSLQALVQDGLSVVLITHKLREVLGVCHRISVLREGKNVVTLARTEANEEQLVRAMVGDELNVKTSLIFSKGATRTTTNESPGRELVQCRELQVKNPDGLSVLRECSFAIREGEILGVAGVAGNGQRELAECLCGVRPLSSGEIIFDGRAIHTLASHQRIEAGLAYVPEDRLSDGFLPKANVAQNLILGAHRDSHYARGNFINWQAVVEQSRRVIKEYGIRTAGPQEIGGNLSGGNIQRVMIARALAQDPRWLIAHNPTRGLDLASTEFVYTKLLARKQARQATLLLSEDLDELLLLCDRIAVMYKGKINGLVARGEFDKYHIGQLMSGSRG